MKRLLSLLLALCLCVGCAGCGNIFVRGTLQPGFSTVSGVVSIVHLSAIIGGDGNSVQITFVTFLQNGTGNTIGFCGDQRDQFPLNQLVRTNFTPGTPCATLVVVVIIT
jgi:hypothetical protein